MTDAAKSSLYRQILEIANVHVLLDGFHHRRSEIPVPVMAELFERAIIANRSGRTATMGAGERLIMLTISGFSFQEFPPQVVGRLFPNVSHIEITSNSTFRSLETLWDQFPNLVWLTVTNCPMMVDVAPLPPAAADPATDAIEGSIIPHQPSLRGLHFSNCPIRQLSEELFASPAMGALRRIHLDKIPYLEELPSSICSSNNNLTHLHTLIFADCPHLKRLPREIGNLSPTLRRLEIHGETRICELPSTLGRLQDDCKFLFVYWEQLKKPSAEYLRERNGTIIGSTTTTTTTTTTTSGILQIREIRKYFDQERLKFWRGVVRLIVLFQRARRRANERLYRPGGAGYDRCKEQFESALRFQQTKAIKQQANRTEMMHYIGPE